MQPHCSPFYQATRFTSTNFKRHAECGEHKQSGPKHDVIRMYSSSLAKRAERNPTASRSGRQTTGDESFASHLLLFCRTHSSDADGVENAWAPLLAVCRYELEDGVGGRSAQGTVEYDTPDKKTPSNAKPSSCHRDSRRGLVIVAINTITA